MKKINYLLLMSLLVLGMISCSTDDAIENEDTDPNSEYVEVAFNFGGEYLEETETPLSRAVENPKTYYGIEVLEKHVWDELVTGHTVTHTDYDPYAYGLFTSKENMRVQLKKGETYRINSTVIKERTDTLYHKGNDFYYPFADYSSNPVQMNNRFVMDPYYDAVSFDQYEISTENEYGIRHARMDRYYGCDEYDITENKNTLSLNLKRYTFGLKFVVTPPVDGTLKIESPELHYVREIEGNKGTFEEQEYFATATNSQTYVENPDYAEQITIIFYWSRKDGSNETYNKKITVKRNVLKTLYINLNNRDYESGFEFNLEDGPMQEETEEIN